MNLRRPAITILLLSGIAQSQSSRVLTREDEAPFILKRAVSPPYNSPQPIWSGHNLLSVEISESREPVLHATTRDGRSEEVRLSMPDWGLLTVNAFWSGDDGQIILAGNGVTESGEKAGILGWIGADRTERRILKVPGYSLHVMTVGPGGVIWAIGSSREEHPVDNILLRFSPKGKLLTSTYLSVRGGGRLRPDGPPLGGRDVAFSSAICGSVDRVAWLTKSNFGLQNEYLEFDSSGTEIMRLNGPPPATRFDAWPQTLAVSRGNSVLISMRNSQGKTPRQDFWSLDRVKQRWFRSEVAEAAFPQNTQIYGFDGEDLMTSGYKPQLGQLLVRYRLSETK